MRPRSQIVLPLLSAALLTALIVAILVGGAPGGSSSSKAPTATPGTGFDGAALAPAKSAPAFTLTDQDGRRTALRALRGGVTVLGFLYTGCGAPCVVIAQQIRGALDELPRPVPVLLVSVDPRADTPKAVRGFLEQVSLTGRVRYLTGTPAQLRSVWHAYGVVPASAGSGAFARYASVLLIDPRGRERVLFQSEQLTPEALSHDIGKLQNG